MKKWTKKFIAGLPASKAGENDANSRTNSRRAQRKLKFPSHLWMELSAEAEILRQTNFSAVTAFAAGMAVGWAEHEKSVK